jgi:hypothetical protein
MMPASKATLADDAGASARVRSDGEIDEAESAKWQKRPASETDKI